MYYELKTTTGRVANLLNEYTPTHRLPPELLTRIFDLVVDRDSEEYTKRIIPLTHICQYWRTAIMSHARIWSTLRMKPGDPGIISEWLARSKKATLTVIAEFTDTYEHPPCRYQDSATATLADGDTLNVCPRHKAVLSLDKLLPHRSRIRNLNILLHSSDPEWVDDDREDEPTLLHHPFFKKTLPNLQRLDFRAAHVEQDRYTILIPNGLFAKKLPRLRELKYLGVTGGLTETAKGLISCEIGCWSQSAGPTIIDEEELWVFLNNNKTLKSLTINECEFASYFRGSTPIIMTDLEFLKIGCPIDDDLQKILQLIHVPQFKDLDTVHLSLRSPRIEMVATNSPGHTFEFLQFVGDNLNFDPLQRLGANITTLRLGRGATLEQRDEPTLFSLFKSLDTVQVLEFDGTIAHHVQLSILCLARVFPGLQVIRVAVGRDGCKRTLQLLATISKLRMERGNPLATVEQLVLEGDDELNQRLRAKWKKLYKAEGIQNFLSR